MGRKKKIPAWYAARARERGVRVGDQLIWTAGDVIALIDRVNARYRALALAVAHTDASDPELDPLGSDWRAAWAGQYRAWLDFAEQGRGIWGSAWGSTSETAQAFDQELDAYRAAFEERTGTEVPNPTSSTTSEQGRPSRAPSFLGGLLTGAGGAVTLLAAGALVVAIASRSK